MGTIDLEEEEFVDFKTSQLLKDKNFKVWCKFRWTDFNGVEKRSEGASEVHPYAPKKHKVVEWLRVNHGIWVRVECDCHGEIWYSKLFTCSKETWENIELRSKILGSGPKFHEWRNSQQALGEGILYVLENILP